MSGVPPSSRLRWTGRCADLSAEDRRGLFDRATSKDGAVRQRTGAIIAQVRASRDAALYALATELDGVSLDSLEVPRALWTTALDALDLALRRAMERSAENIRRVHRAFLQTMLDRVLAGRVALEADFDRWIHVSVVARVAVAWVAVAWVAVHHGCHL